ncbi:hypothetical protein LOTGIDRAFT_194691 [Lottia gigantea]|uniref:Spermatogenesis-associated protein 17 n=1 Tax=Lottia gigantea TaxID=225164 RepID=V3ZR22_LOTGI|nr:hypothetical protein LOTGIDRAFT_194691 [Lottia gigantea]ESO86817.1 hypothetical protein LOTGIDRAFT_194691 [Lottia gigantea]
MAAMVRLQRQVNNIVEETYARKNEAEERRNQEFLAAVEIQSWFRGCRTRGYLKFLNRCATSVQRRWRGFLGRRFYRVLIQNSVFQAKLRFYNQQASKIQKVWKGYYVRKYVFNYYSRKHYLESLQIKNEIIRSELEEYAEQQSQIRQKQADEEERQARVYEARKNHYLISTEVIPGVYNSPFLPFPSANEYVLRNVKPLDRKKKLTKKSDPGWKSCEFPRPEKLPPLVNKPQGPFREPADVQSQRYKNFQPSLRVATDFFSLEEARKTMKAEEWVTRINDDLFLPVGKKEARYQPLLYTTSKYGHLPYGTKYFREVHIDRHITPQPFKTLVPPIPVFDKLNNTYSQGQV